MNPELPGKARLPNFDPQVGNVAKNTLQRSGNSHARDLPELSERNLERPKARDDYFRLVGIVSNDFRIKIFEMHFDRDRRIGRQSHTK